MGCSHLMRWLAKAYDEWSAMKTNLLLTVALTLVVCMTGAAPASVFPASERPAITVLQPTRAALLGAALAGSRIVALGERGIVILSDDQGRTWRQVNTPVSVTLTAVRFADSQRGYAVGHAGIVLVTQDSGETWTKSLDGVSAATLILAEAKASAQGSADTEAAHAALKEAQRLVEEGADKPWLDLQVVGANRIVVVGAYGLVMASDDGGASWHSWANRLPNPGGLHLYAIRSQGPRWLIVGEQGLVLASSDDGATFQRMDTPYQGSFFTAELVGTTGVLAAGLRGNALYSPDGENWRTLNTSTPSSYVASTQVSGQRLLLVNQAGQLLEWSVGETSQPINVLTRPVSAPTGLLPLVDGTVLVLSQYGLKLLPEKLFSEGTKP